MTLIKAQIVDSIDKKAIPHKNKASEAVKILIEIIKRTLESGEDVMISGFGKFCVKEKDKRKGRNPATGKAMTLKPRRVVTFRCSGKLREKINGKKKGK